MRYTIILLSIIILYLLIDTKKKEFSSAVAKNSPPGVTAELMRLKYLFLKSENLDGWSPEEIAYYESIKAKQSEILFEALTDNEWRDIQAIQFVNEKFHKNFEVKVPSGKDRRIQETVRKIIHERIK